MIDPRCDECFYPLDLAEHAAAGAKATADPLIPERVGAEEGLVADLERSGVKAARAGQIAAAVAEEATEAALAVRVKAKEERNRCMDGDLARGLTAKLLHADDAKAKVTLHKHTLDVFAAHRPKKLLKVTTVHYRKLHALWRRQYAIREPAKAAKAAQAQKQGKQPGGILGEGEGSKEEQQRFHNDLLCVLLRYHALQGHGFQAAAGEHVFHSLLEHAGAKLECFASPLNCHFRSFCSAFVDTDAPFGSIGDFFTFRPSRGSFQANPPFVPEVRAALSPAPPPLCAAEYRTKPEAASSPAVSKANQSSSFREQKTRRGDNR